MTTTSSTRRSLVSGSAFALANTAERALTFILLPVYTTVLSPAEYGRLGLLVTVQSGASIAFAAGMEAAVLRGFFQREGDPNAQQRYVISIWNLLLVAVPLLALIAAVPLILFVPKSAVFYPSEGALALAVAASAVAYNVVPFTVMRAEQRLKHYIIVTGFSGVSTATLAVLLVVVLRLGVSGWLFAALISNCMCLALTLHLTPWRRVHGFDWHGVRAALSLGLPLIPHAASLWSLQLADRIILAALVTASALGIYTLGANIALPAMIVIQSLNYGFLPSYARTQSDRSAVRELRNTITIQVVLVLTLSCTVALLGGPFVTLISPSYAGAARLIPWLVLGYVFLGFYFIPMNVVSLVAGRTKFVWIFTLTSALVNLGAIYAFVPRYGIIAAAEASALGYLVLFVLITLYAKRLRLALSVDWRRISLSTCAVGVTYGAGATLIPDSAVVDLIARSGVLATLPVSLMLAIGYPPSQAIAQIRRLAKQTRAVQHVCNRL